MGMGLVPFYRILLEVAKFSASECKWTWQSTIPETLAKTYGAWCIPEYSAIWGANSTCTEYNQYLKD